MSNVFETLQERGFIKQMTHEEEIKELLNGEPISFYIGFDATADSLHVGHFLQLMAMAHLQRAGHRPIALLGGGTTMVGDPTGKTDMRKMLTVEEINHNAECFKKQMSNFLDFSEGKAIMANNADWLMNLEYIPFLREIGRHFSVNRMLTAECFKSRMEKGLSFLEFNYMIMQAYDFLVLNDKYGCKLELGGDDQWSNIIAGADLIRRKKSESAYGMTFTLLTNSEGKKMGKTESGAVWLDAEKTSPYDFFQYWRNIADADVRNCLCLLTFLPMDEIETLSNLEGSEINKAKERLAFEVTKIVHSEDDAIKAQQAARALFEKGSAAGSAPCTEMSSSEFEDGIEILNLLSSVKLIPSKKEGRRLIEQGGVQIDDVKITDVKHMVTLDSFVDGSIMIKKARRLTIK